MSKIYTFVRNHAIKEKLKMIADLAPKKRTLLDIGCGTGSFIEAGKQDGWTVYGTEPDSAARKIAHERVGDAVYSSINEVELTDKKFEIITLWHVLEHVHLLNETIDWLSQHLTENGKIIIAVPNPQSYDAAKYGRFWAAYDVPRHLYHFTKASMKQLLNKHELFLESILPMWFDSFYVAMLSTKYKAKGVGLTDSLKTGILSNIKGRSKHQEGINTSSLIYIVTKK